MSSPDVDKILEILNKKDIEQLKKEDYEQFQYQGFDPYRLVAALNEMKTKGAIDDKTFSDDICKMIAVGLIKGNVNDHNITKMTDDGQKDLKNLMQKYSIKMGGGRGVPAHVITFPRVMATFPDIAVRMTKVIGGKEFRGGPFHSAELPFVMQVQVFPAVIPHGFELKTKRFLLIASLCYSLDQTIQISRIDKPDFPVLASNQEQFLNVSHNSPLPKEATRRQTFNQLGLPSKYEDILKVVTMYQELVDKSYIPVTKSEYEAALSVA